MAFARTCAVALVGVEGVVVEVQADLEPGVAAFTLVGLPDKSLSESRDRVRAALVNSGEEWPQRKLTVGLSPASVPKSGSGFDLANLRLARAYWSIGCRPDRPRPGVPPWAITTRDGVVTMCPQPGCGGTMQPTGHGNRMCSRCGYIELS